MAVAGDAVWVANRNVKGVLVLDIATGEQRAVLGIPRPIGVVYSAAHGLVLIGSRVKERHAAKIRSDAMYIFEIYVEGVMMRCSNVICDTPQSNVLW